MGITKIVGPSDATAAVERGLASLRRAKGMVNSVEAGGGPSPPVNASLPVYHIDATRPLSSSTKPADSARQKGWRYVLGDGDASQAIDVVDKKVSSIIKGKLAAHLNRALTVASAHVDAEQNYEARVLVFGRAGESVLWLHANLGSDRFFSLDAQPRELDEIETMANVAGKAQLRRDTKLHREITTTHVDEDESGG